MDNENKWDEKTGEEFRLECVRMERINNERKRMKIKKEKEMMRCIGMCRKEKEKRMKEKKGLRRDGEKEEKES